VIASPKMPPSRDYCTTGPYTVSITGEGNERNLTLEEAVEVFVRYALPPCPGQSAAIMDRDGVIGAGYHAVRQDSNADPAFKWTGTVYVIGALCANELVYPLLRLDIEAAVE